jgi:hypothetical protein
MAMSEWYTNNRMDLLLLVDEMRGIRTLHGKFTVPTSPGRIDITGRRNLATKLTTDEYLDADFLRERMKLAKDMFKIVYEE